MFLLKALILAAGVGSRLKPLTDDVPKSLVEVNGEPILFKQIENLQENGIFDITIIAGYKFSVLEKAVKEKFDNINIINNIDYLTTNNMYSAYLARDSFYGEDFLMMNADVYFDSIIISDLLFSKKDSLVAVDVGKYNEESMKVIERDGKLVSISKEITKDEALGNSIDVYKFSKDSGKKFFDSCTKYVEDDKNLGLWSEVALNDILKNCVFLSSPIQGRWMEIDNLDDLKKAQKIFSTGKKKNMNKKLFLFDMDGTIYLDGKIFDGTLELMRKIKNNGGRYVFITNNSSHSLDFYVNKIRNYNIEVDRDNFYTSTLATIGYLKKNYDGKLVYCMGTRSLVSELLDAGINVTTRYNKNTDVVLLGYDTELNYNKLRIVSKLLTINKNIAYIATHSDYVCPVDFGFVPDCGAMVDMIELSTGRRPIFIGKPHATMINFVLEKFNVEKCDAVMIGDRLYTDIAAGLNAGVDTICVLSGETTKEDILNSEIKPDYVMQDVKEILQNIK